MQFLNIRCDQSRVRNTGVPSCTRNYGTWKDIILVPKDWTLNAAELADFVDSIQAAMVEDDYDERIFLLGNFVSVEAAYGDKTTVTNQDGSEDIVRAATVGWNCTIKRGGSCYSRALLSFDNLEDYFNVVIISRAPGRDGDQFIGTEYYNTTTQLVEFTGMALSKLEVPTPVIGAGDDVDKYMVSFRLKDASQLLDRGFIVDTTINATEDLNGIVDVYLTQLGLVNGTGGVSVGMKAGCGATSLATSALAATWANVARIIVTNYLTGALITKTSMAVSGDGFLIDVDHTDTDYPASGEYMAIALEDPSVLNTAGLGYYESYANNPAVGVSGTQLLVKIP